MFLQLLECALKYIPVGAILISLGSLWIAVVSLRRSRTFQRYEYSPRLELMHELIQFATPSGDQVHVASWGSEVHKRTIPTLIKDPFSFAYSALLVNKGGKTVQVHGTTIEYGSASDPARRMKRAITGEAYLAAGDKAPWSLS